LSEANLDHLVVGPAGVLLIDTKNWSGHVTQWEGSLYRHTFGADGTRKHQSMHEQVAKVHGMGARVSELLGAPVTPVICLAGANAERFGEPQQVRGVWVVSIGQLAGWLTARTARMDTETVTKLSTRLMTEFPSTTTDPELLAAIGRASLATTQARRGAGFGRRPRDAVRNQRVSRSRGNAAPWRPVGRRFVSVLGRIAVAGLLVGLFLILLKVIPSMLTSGVERLAEPRAEGAPSVMATPTASGSGLPAVASKPAPRPKPKPTATPTRPVPKAVATPLAPPDCADASGAEIAKIIGRSVRPVVVSNGCAWGTRLDDPSTVLVTIRMSAGHASYEMQLETSVKQRRAVYGTTYDASYDRATALWIATGQPIRRGASVLPARADTHVVVASTDLGVTDDRGRALALAIAAAANHG
jgi:hypothetical protein